MEKDDILGAEELYQHYENLTKGEVSMNKTIIFPSAGNVELQDRECPKPQKGEVLIRTEVSLVSIGTELTFLNGECPKDSKWSSYIHYPMTPGYSNVGVVVETGEGVSKEWIGRRVASFSKHAQYVTAKEEELRVIRYDITSEEAAFFAIAEVGLNGIRRTKIELGNRVVVYGAGVIGQVLVRYLLAGGCTEIVVVNRSQKRLEYLPKSSAVIPVSSKTESVMEAVKQATQGELADIVFETTGNADLIPEEFQVLHQQGKLCMLSSPRKETKFDFHDFCNAGSFQIIGAHISSQAVTAGFDDPWTCVRNSEVFFKMIATGQMEVASLISHRVFYEEAAGIYKQMQENRSPFMGVVIQWR